MAFTHRLISLTSQADWDSCLQDMPHGPAHTWAYNHAIAQSISQPIYLYVLQSNNAKAICPIIVREKFCKSDIVTPYGFGGLITQGEGDFAKEWQSFFASKEMVCAYVGLHPLFMKNTQGFENEMHAAALIYCLDINAPLETLFANFAKTHRYELRQSEQQSVNIIHSKSILQASLYALYQQTLARVSASNVYNFSEKTLEEIIQNPNTIALGIEENGKIEAISLFIHNQYIADYFLNAATSTGRKHARLLIWEAIKLLKKLNVPRLNFGGGVKQGDELEQFKRRFGGDAITYHVLRQVFLPTIYKALCAAANHPKTSYFPEYYAQN